MGYALGPTNATGKDGISLRQIAAPCTGATHAALSLADFAALEFAGLQDNGAGGFVEMRNCGDCGSTLGRDVPTLLPLPACPVDTDAYHGPCVTSWCRHGVNRCCGELECDVAADECCSEPDDNSAYEAFEAERMAHS